jgi:hypothetical protein
LTVILADIIFKSLGGFLAVALVCFILKTHIIFLIHVSRCLLIKL